MKIGTDKQVNTTVASFFAGGILGAGTALMLAPKSGKQFRRDLNRLAVNTGSRASAAIDKGKDILEEGKEKVTAIVEESKTAFNKGKEQVAGLVRQDRSVLVPFVAGSVGGAMLALLLAPKPGKELRRDLKQFAGSTADQVAAAVEKGKGIYEEGKTKISGAIDAGKKRIQESLAA